MDFEREQWVKSSIEEKERGMMMVVCCVHRVIIMMDSIWFNYYRVDRECQEEKSTWVIDDGDIGFNWWTMQAAENFLFGGEEVWLLINDDNFFSFLFYFCYFYRKKRDKYLFWWYKVWEDHKYIIGYHEKKIKFNF